VAFDEHWAAAGRAEMAIEGRGRGVVMGVALGKAEMGTGDEADADEGATGGALAHTAVTDGLVPRDVVDFVAGGATETAAGEGSGGSHCAWFLQPTFPTCPARPSRWER